MFRALFLSAVPALVILAFRTLCTSRPAPTPDYLVEKKPAPCRGHGVYF
jgi:hypothetical protein